jgi:hypothetical protein
MTTNDGAADDDEIWEDAARVDKLKALAMEWEHKMSGAGATWFVEPVAPRPVSSRRTSLVVAAFLRQHV